MVNKELAAKRRIAQNEGLRCSTLLLSEYFFSMVHFNVRCSEN